MSRIIATLMFVIVIAAGMPSMAADRPRQSGTVASIDPAAHTITLEEIGPWHGPTTPPTRRTIPFSPSTRIELVKRSAQPTAGGWPGEYVESPLSPAEVRPGDFATVELAHENGRLVATTIDVVRPTS